MVWRPFFVNFASTSLKPQNLLELDICLCPPDAHDKIRVAILQGACVRPDS